MIKWGSIPNNDFYRIAKDNAVVSYRSCVDVAIVVKVCDMWQMVGLDYTGIQYSQFSSPQPTLEKLIKRMTEEWSYTPYIMTDHDELAVWLAEKLTKLKEETVEDEPKES